MTAFASGAAGGSQEWQAVCHAALEDLGTVPAGANIGFIYVTDVLAHALPHILDAVRERTGVRDWVGTVGFGVCASGREFYDEPAISVLVCALPDDSFRLLPTVTGPLKRVIEWHGGWLADNQPVFGVVHGDPNFAGVPDVVETLAEASGGFLVGGLTSSRGEHYQVAGGLTSGGVSGVIFGPGVSVATGLSQGCMPIGPVHEVTESSGNILISVDGEPALDVFKRDIGDVLARRLERTTGYIHAAFPVSGDDTGDYVVRNLLGFDPERGWLAVGEAVDTGDRLMFCRRDPQAARDDLSRMLGALEKRLDRRPRAALYYSCVARGPHMFGEKGSELAILREALGDIPLAGFYANGEVSNNRLYGYTGVLALFL
ncbi:MAG: FIST C-terminal domain-containing protein [bacterium]|nr:FIST C-terminal domain-containing protein [bacterium]